MVTKTQLNALTERFQSDARDYEGVDSHSHGLIDYLKDLIDDGLLVNDAAIGSAKRAVVEGMESLSESQIRALALDMLNNDTYLSECELCLGKIAWSDMVNAIREDDGKCSDCAISNDIT